MNRGKKMMELYGADDCESCVEAKNFLGKTPLEWKYVDVSTINFEGQIPRLVLENGQNIKGFPAIKSFVKQKMKSMGFPEGML